MSEFAPQTDALSPHPSTEPSVDSLIGRVPGWGLEEKAARESVARRLFGRGRRRMLGRYELGERLGRGGMGEVWAAFDTRLEREVAIKTVRASALSRPRERQALIEEARTLAKLRDPNVLSVYDVLDIDELVVIVMERVDGETLGAWAVGEGRTRRQVWAALQSAARGLVAAHAAGFAHLDFKPDNILVGRDGRVLVADFGLARSTAGPRTRISGTPGFAAPEQWGGQATLADARTDQFAFAATVCALLARRLPLGVGDPKELDEPTFRAAVRSVVSATGLSRARKVALRRALARRPVARFESMAELVDALFTRPRARLRLASLAGAAVVAVSIGVGAARALQTPRSCAGVSAEAWLSSAWDPAQREAFLAAARATPGLYTGARHAATELDEQRRELAQQWPSVCGLDVHLGGDSSATATRRCVERKRRELASVSRMLAEPSGRMLERAPEIAAELSSVDDCRFAARPGVSVAAGGDVELELLGQAHAALAAAKVHRRAGQREQQRAALQRAAEIVAQLGDLGLGAEVDQRLGHVAVEDGAVTAGLDQVERAYFAALESGEDLLAADTASLLVFLAGGLGRYPVRARGWARHAEALFAKLEVDALREARLLAHRGAMEAEASHPAESLSHYRRAVGVLRESGVEAPILMLSALNGVAIGLETTGDPRAALEIYAEIEPLIRHLHGDQHPRYGALINNIGGAHQAIGEFDLAIELHERAESIAVLHGLANLRHGALVNLCFAHASARHGERGLPHCEAGLELCLELHEADDCTSDQMALGNTLAALGEGERALAAYRAAFEGYAAIFAAEDPAMVWAWSSLGAGHVAVEDWPSAHAAYERALDLVGVSPLPAAEVAEIQFGLARASLGLGKPLRAEALALEALAAYGQSGQVVAEQEVREWLDTHFPTHG